MLYPEKSLLFDLSLYSPCYYGPVGGNYGLGRVAVGFSQGLTSRFGHQLGLCSYLSSAEAPLILARDQPALLQYCIEPEVTRAERLMMKWVNPTDARGNLKKDVYSKIRRQIWSNGINNRRWEKRPETKAIYTNAKLIHSELVIPLELRASRAKRVYTLHDLIGLRDPHASADSRDHLARQLRKDFEAGATFCCDSQYTADDLKNFLNTSSERIQAAPLGLDHQFYKVEDAEGLKLLRDRLGLTEGQKFIVANTGEIQRKNLLEIVKTVDLVRKNGYPDMLLVFAGVSKSLPKQFSDALGSSVDWQKFVRFTGFLSDAEFRILYSGAELMLFLSLAEGFGLPPLEAMGCGAPVVCSDRTSLPEAVGNAALLVDPDDTDAVLSAVLSVLGDELLRKRLIESGLERAGEMTWDRTATHLERIWQTALAS